jgi:hypothetical protein
MARIPPTLFFLATCAVIGLLADLVLRRWLHWFSRNSWGGIYLTVALWWVIAASRLAPSRAEAKLLGPRDTRIRVWDAYRATLWPTLKLLIPGIVSLALLYRVGACSE